MQQQQSFSKKMLPLFFAFVLVNSLVLFYQKDLNQNNIDALVVFAANGLLFILSVLSLAMHTKPVDKKNPHAVVRAVMLATLLKLMVLGISAMFYLIAAGSNRSIGAIIAGMILYVIYTFIEVRIASKPNQNNNAGK